MASKLKQNAAGKQKRNLVEWFAEQVSKASQSCANIEPSLRRTMRRDLEKAAGKVSDQEFQKWLYKNGILSDPDKYLGKFRRQMLDDLSRKGAGMTRFGFLKWFDAWMNRMEK